MQYLNGLKDVTYGCLVVLSGQPDHDSTTKTAVTLGSGGLDVVLQSEHTFKYLEAKSANIVRTNNLATSFAVSEAAILVGGTTTGTNAEA